MKEYTYEMVDEHIQWLIRFMETEYPNDYELTLNSCGANIRSTLNTLTFLNDKYKNYSHKDRKKVLEDIKKQIIYTRKENEQNE